MKSHALAALFASLLASLLASEVFALDEPDLPRVHVQVSAGELDYLNSLTPLPRVLLDIEDAASGSHVTLDVGQELRVHAENFDPVTGGFLESSTFYRDAGPLTFTLPTGFIPGEHRLYAEDAAQQQEPANFSVEFEMPGDPVKRSEAMVVGQSTLTVVAQTGSAANRLDFVLIGDGYTQAESAKWRADAQKIVDNFFSVAPYNEYRSYFNIYRIDAYSEQSGADHPKGNDLKNTAFDAQYDCQDIARLICASTGKVQQEVAKHLASEARDIILLIVNDSEYGGSGGAIGIISTHSSALELAHHELGHSFGNLGDEYVDTAVVAPADCRPDVEPVLANVSKHYTERASVKWAHWIATATRIPTPFIAENSTPGLYAGSGYCENLYRPTPNSKMRTLGRPFDAINEEHLVLRFYDYVNLLESVTPTTGQSVNLGQGTVTHFSFKAMQPFSTGVTAAWFLDKVQIASSITLPASLIPPGQHLLELEVTDPTPKVRRDNFNKLSKRASWAVTGGSGSSLTRAEFNNQLLTIPVVRLPDGQSYKAVLKLVPSSSGLVVELEEAVPITRATAATDAVFALGVLTVPEVTVGALVYRATLKVIPNSSPLRLQVVSAPPVR